MCRASGVTKTCCGRATVAIFVNAGLSFDSLNVHVSEVVDGTVREAGFTGADGITAAGVGPEVGGALRDEAFVVWLHATHVRRMRNRITPRCLSHSVRVVAKAERPRLPDLQ
jgi:hypothetical protein